MVLKHPEQIEQRLRRDVPVLLLDQDRIVTRANLLLLWVYGALRIGEACEPGHIVGQHGYETLARSIDDGRLSLDDPDNEEFIVGRLRAIVDKPDENHPAVQRFLQRVYTTPEARRRWEAAIAAYDGYGDPFALDENHYPEVLQHPNGLRLHFVVTVDRLDEGGRLISLEPWEGDASTRDAVVSAYDTIKTVYPQVDYVQDVRHLTAFFPAEGHTSHPVRPMMQSERESLGESEGVPDDQAGRLSSDSVPKATIPTQGVTTEWRPSEAFPRAHIDQALGTQAVPLKEHPVYGPGFAWELAGNGGDPTRLEVFPERRWANVRYLDGSLQQQQRGLILDYLTVRLADSRPILSMVSAREGRRSLINVYPSGEVDEFFRLQPANRSLPSEALIFEAQRSTPPAAPAPHEQPALTVVEAARYLGIGPEQVRVLLRAHDLLGFKRAGAWYVPMDALAEFQASRRGQTRQQVDVKAQIATYNQAYYEQRKQDPEWRERRRAQAREAMRRKREREREASPQAHSEPPTTSH